MLAASLFWLDDHKWWPYVPAFVGAVAPAERRLRWWRWLSIGMAAHIIGTYVSQSYLQVLIRTGRAPRRLVDARDVGVSYFMLGVIGTLTGYIRPTWRTRCQAAGAVAQAANVAIRPTFTEVGHLTAYLVGLAAIPLAPDRDRMPYPQLPSDKFHDRHPGQSWTPCSGNVRWSAEARPV